MHHASASAKAQGKALLQSVHSSTAHCVHSVLTRTTLSPTPCRVWVAGVRPMRRTKHPHDRLHHSTSIDITTSSSPSRSSPYTTSPHDTPAPRQIRHSSVVKSHMSSSHAANTRRQYGRKQACRGSASPHRRTRMIGAWQLASELYSTQRYRYARRRSRLTRP